MHLDFPRTATLSPFVLFYPVDRDMNMFLAFLQNSVNSSDRRQRGRRKARGLNLERQNSCKSPPVVKILWCAPGGQVPRLHHRQGPSQKDLHCQGSDRLEVFCEGLCRWPNPGALVVPFSGVPSEGHRRLTNL